VAGTHQLDVVSYERGAAARVRDDVVEVEVVGASAFDTFALIPLPDGKLDLRWDESILREMRFARIDNRRRVCIDLEPEVEYQSPARLFNPSIAHQLNSSSEVVSEAKIELHELHVNSSIGG
jgi:hypothetical protein